MRTVLVDLSTMTWAREFASVRAAENNTSGYKVNNPADISVIVVYFVVVLGVGIWVSALFYSSTAFLL